MFGKVNCIAAAGIDGYVVEVEADVANGLPSFDMVGFLASEVKEAKERVRTALRNSGYSMPPSRITVNLSPADRRGGGENKGIYLIYQLQLQFSLRLELFHRIIRSLQYLLGS